VVNKSDDHPDRNGKKRNVLRHCLNIASDGAAVTCDGRLFQKLAPDTGKAHLPRVETKEVERRHY